MPWLTKAPLPKLLGPCWLVRRTGLQQPLVHSSVRPSPSLLPWRKTSPLKLSLAMMVNLNQCPKRKLALDPLQAAMQSRRGRENQVRARSSRSQFPTTLVLPNLSIATLMLTSLTPSVARRLQNKHRLLKPRLQLHLLQHLRSHRMLRRVPCATKCLIVALMAGSIHPMIYLAQWTLWPRTAVLT